MRNPTNIPDREHVTNARATPARARRLGLAAAGAALAVAVTGGVAAAPLSASAASTVPVTTATASPGHVTWCGVDLLVLRHGYDRLPTAMRTAISAAHKQSSTTARKDAVAKVLATAKSGGYGTAIEAVAKDKKTLDGVVDAWDKLPSALSSDLKTAKAATGTQRASDLEAIIAKAESGGYGDRVKDVSGKLTTRLGRCVARLKGSSSSTSGSSTMTPSTSTPTATTGA